MFPIHKIIFNTKHNVSNPCISPPKNICQPVTLSFIPHPYCNPWASLIASLLPDSPPLLLSCFLSALPTTPTHPETRVQG